MDLKGKVAIVTGAKRGIGRAISIALAKESVNLAIFSKDCEGLVAFAGELMEINPDINVYFRPVNITQAHEVSLFIHQVQNRFGKIDILINNAGVIIPGNIEDKTIEEWDLVIDTNLKGPFLMIKGIVPLMIENKKGHIVNINSLMGKRTFAGGGLYSASKFGLDGFSKSIAKELREHNITVTSIYPSFVDTDMLDDLHKEVDRKKTIKPEEIADSVVFALKNAENCNLEEITVFPEG